VHLPTLLAVRRPRVANSRQGRYYNPELTIGDVQANLEQIRDQTGATQYTFQVGPEILDTMSRRAYVPR
jgi:hypothetical protein